ncbi:MAG TPA: SPASM domain-containing protein [bacterium]|nr:SPASM domain-containing protein [bacterium]
MITKKIERKDPCCGDKGQKFVSNVNFWLTEDCNFRCKYCYEKEKKRTTATKEIIDQLLIWLTDNRISGNSNSVSINFFGGEPLLNPDLILYSVLKRDLIEFKTNKKITLSMTTNASLLNEELIKLFHKYNIGCLISIDGTLDTMIKWRGINNQENILRKVVENAEIYNRYNLKATARLTLPNPEVKNLARNVMFLYGLGFSMISAHIITDGDGEIQPDGVDEYRRQLDLMYDWFKSFYIRGQEIPYNTVNRILTRMNKNLDASPCGAGKGFLGVSPTGELYPCHRFVIFPEFKIGDIFNYELNQEIRDKFINLKRKSCDKCIKCPSLVCWGQCPASSYVKFGDIYTPHPELCKIVLAEEEVAKRLLTEKKKITITKNFMPQKGVIENGNHTNRTHKANTGIIRR